MDSDRSNREDLARENRALRRRLARMEGEARQKRLKAVGRLAGKIAHRLNNVLGIVLLNSSVLRMRLTETDPLLKVIADSEAALEQARELNQQLLDLSQDGEAVKTPVLLEPLIREAAASVLTDGKRGFHLSCPPGLWTAAGDPVQIGGLFQHLIRNAAQAMPTEGSIDCSLENFAVDEESVLPLPAGPYVRCRVADEGSGIPPQDLEPIFDPYFTTRQDALGLGLSLALVAACGQGGWITVESLKKGGVEAAVFLPVDK